MSLLTTPTTPTTTTTTPTTIRSLDSLAHHEVCIDGLIYDLSEFRHPGGDVPLQIFGGTDVTVLYRMIHPHHPDHHDHHDHHDHPPYLTKKIGPPVGVVADYECEYKFDSDFAVELKREVFKLVPRGHEFATPGFLGRLVVYMALYLYLTVRWLQQQDYDTDTDDTSTNGMALAMSYGISWALVGLNIQHDANHGAIAGKRPTVWINDVLGYGADLLGNTKWVWLQQHWTHHAFTNNCHKDPDVVAAEPLMIFHPYPVGHPARRWYHAYQWICYVPAFMGYWLSTAVFSSGEVWTLQKQQQQQKQRTNSNNNNKNNNRRFLNRQRPVAVCLRLLHWALTFGAPIYHAGGVTVGAVGRALLVGATGGLVLGILFSLSHNFEGAERTPIVSSTSSSSTSTNNKNNHKNNNHNNKVCWYKSQVETSCSYGGFISACLTGGLNLQIEHHLFPRMNSAWYPYIAPTVRRLCRQHGVRYTYFPYFHQNWASFFRYLCATGQKSGNDDNNNNNSSSSSNNNNKAEEPSLASRRRRSSSSWASFLMATVVALGGVVWAAMELSREGASTTFPFNTTL